MFDYKLALVIMVFAVPGLAVTIPRLLKKLSGTVASKLPAGKKLPPVPVLITVQILQSLLLVGGFAFLGAFLAPRVGQSFGRPFQEWAARLSAKFDGRLNVIQVIGDV